MMKIKLALVFAFILYSWSTKAQSKLLVFQSDFGLKDGAVAAMKGVAIGVSPDLRIFDLTHEIPVFNIWEAAYRLEQTARYWPSGTVFVSIIDPGVGSSRKSIVMKTKSGHYFVTPDNGTLTLVAESLGIEEVREIDETRNRLRSSNESYTFHGRDVYAYTGARLASGVISFSEVGSKVSKDVVRVPYQKAEFKENILHGTVDILDVQYGNVWTNIPQSLVTKAGLHYGDSLSVKIFSDDQPIYEGTIPFETTFSAVGPGDALAYLNSLLNFSLGINLGSFAAKHHIESGPKWKIEVRKR